MITCMIEFLETRASIRLALLLVMIIVPITALVYPLINEELVRISGYPRLDDLFYFTPRMLFERVEAYGDSGRTIYLASIAAVDFVFPILYSLLIGFLLTLVLRTGMPANHPLHRMQLFPAGMLVFNYLHNIFLSAILLQYPSRPEVLAWLTTGSATLKWCFGAFSALALLVGVAGMLYTSFKPNRSNGA